MLSEAPKEHNFLFFLFSSARAQPQGLHWAHTTLDPAACAPCRTVLPALSACAPHAPVFASSYGTLGKTTSVAPGGSGCGGGEPSGRKMSWRSSHLDGQRRRRHHRRVWTGGWAPLQPLLDHPSGKGAPLSRAQRAAVRMCQGASGRRQPASRATAGTIRERERARGQASPEHAVPCRCRDGVL